MGHWAVLCVYMRLNGVNANKILVLVFVQFLKELGRPVYPISLAGVARKGPLLITSNHSVHKAWFQSKFVSLLNPTIFFFFFFNSLVHHRPGIFHQKGNLSYSQFKVGICIMEAEAFQGTHKTRKNRLFDLQEPCRSKIWTPPRLTCFWKHICDDCHIHSSLYYCNATAFLRREQKSNLLCITWGTISGSRTINGDQAKAAQPF